MWFFVTWSCPLGLFLNYRLHLHFCCFGYLIFLRPHVLLKHKCFLLPLLKSEDFQTLAGSFLELQQKWGSQIVWVWWGLKETWAWSLPLQLQDACLCQSYSSCTKWEGCCGYKLQSNLWKSGAKPCLLSIPDMRNIPVLSLVFLPLELASEESAVVWHSWQQLLHISRFLLSLFLFWQWRNTVNLFMYR